MLYWIMVIALGYLLGGLLLAHWGTALGLLVLGVLLWQWRAVQALLIICMVLLFAYGILLNELDWIRALN